MYENPLKEFLWFKIQNNFYTHNDLHYNILDELGERMGKCCDE